MRKTLIILLIFGLRSGLSQELIPNGNFESTSGCPQGYTTVISCPSGSNTICNVPPWQIPDNGSGTPDYFNACSMVSASVPTNHAGEQQAHSGSGYAGLAVWQNGSAYKEYLQVQFSTPMQSGQKYFISFYVSLADIWQIGTSEIGAHISVSPPTGGGQFTGGNDLAGNGLLLSDLNLAYHIKSQEIITDYLNWTQICGIYQATGGEEYITIGGFTPSTAMTLGNGTLGVSANPGAFYPATYYYLDDVSITPFSSGQSVLGSDTTVCAPDYLISADGGSQYEYTWNNGEQDSDLLVDSSGIYWVDVKAGVCVNFRDSIFVNFTTLALDLGPDTTICENGHLELSTTVTNATYLWSTGGTTNAIDVTTEGVYWLEIDNGDCPAKRDSIVVGKSIIETPELGEDRIKCGDEIVILNADYSSFLWSTGDTGSSISISQPGVYWLEYTDGVCPPKRDSIVIETYSLTYLKFEMPNIFTPNQQDAFNSRFTFEIPNIEKVMDYTFTILNRWGNVVFETKDLTEFWDGSSDGKLVSEGVYYWTMGYQSSCVESGKLIMQGDLQLIK